jgi:hypothetical protein
MVDVHPRFQNSKVAFNLYTIYANDCNKRAGRNILPAPEVQQQRRKKRSRDEWEGEENDEFFQEIYEIMRNEDTWPTFLTLIGHKIREQMASTDHEHNSYYKQVENIIVDFEIMMMRAENLFRSGYLADFYYYILDDIGKMLKLSKHQVLYFQLELNQ